MQADRGAARLAGAVAPLSVALATVDAVTEVVTDATAPLPDAAYLTPCDRRLRVAESRVPATDGWRGELDVTTEAVEGRVVGRRRGSSVAAFVRHEWEGEDLAGVRVSVPIGRRR